MEASEAWLPCLNFILRAVFSRGELQGRERVRGSTLHAIAETSLC